VRKRKLLRLEELNWKEIEGLDKERTLVIIPISPLEAHGPHLPVGTDILITEEICKEVVNRIRKKRKGVIPILYPFQAFGYCGATMDAPGTISIDSRTLSKVVYDTLKSLENHGFRNVLIITFHADPFYIKAIHNAIKRMDENLRVSEPISKLYYSNKLSLSHAGKEETSIMLYLYPYLVNKIYKSLNEVNIRFSLIKFRKTLREMGAENIYIGNPSEADIELGRKLFKIIVDFCVNSALELMGDEYRESLPKEIKFLPLFIQRRNP